MSWPTVEINELVKISKGKKHNLAKNKAKYRYIQIDDLRNDNLLKFTDDEKGTFVKPEDVIIAWDGANAGTIGYGLNGLIGSTLARLSIISEDVDTDYLGRFLQSKFRDIRDNCTGATIPHVSKVFLISLEIPLPPLPIQKQIAAVLEKADTLRSQCQQMEQELNTLAQSVFLDMFGDPVTNPKGWEIKKLKDICSSQLGKMLSDKAKQGSNPKQYLRNANVRWRKIQLHDLLKMDFNDKEMKKFTLEYGDLLVCEGGDVGRCAIWKNELNDCYYQKALHRVRVNNEVVIPEYLQEYFYWMSKLGGLSASVSEVTFSHLTAAKMAELKVPVPPLELQMRYKEKVKTLNCQLEQVSSSNHDFDNLFNSLMQRAFKGELTFNDSKDVASLVH
ncbi:MAG: restriction endonuclease subunit S [Marinomonas colpomeniae]